jgi:hypothetical protein
VVGEEAGPPGPVGLIEAKCQYHGEGGERVSVLAVVPPPCGQGTAPSFYRLRGGGLQKCRTIPITCSSMAHSVVE